MPVSRMRIADLAAVRQRGRDDHLPAGIGELDGVREEVEDDLAQRALVGDDVGQAAARSAVRMTTRPAAACGCINATRSRHDLVQRRR